MSPREGGDGHSRVRSLVAQIKIEGPLTFACSSAGTVLALVLVPVPPISPGTADQFRLPAGQRPSSLTRRRLVCVSSDCALWPPPPATCWAGGQSRRGYVFKWKIIGERCVVDTST